VEGDDDDDEEEEKTLGKDSSQFKHLAK